MHSTEPSVPKDIKVCFMDYFPALFNPPLKCCFAGLWGKTYGRVLTLPLPAPGVLPFPSLKCVLDVDGAAQTFPPGSSQLLFAGMNFPSRLSEKAEASG